MITLLTGSGAWLGSMGFEALSCTCVSFVLGIERGRGNGRDKGSWGKNFVEYWEELKGSWSFEEDGAVGCGGWEL